MAAELLLQKTLEITEIKSSEERTLAATRSDGAKRGGDGGSRKQEADVVPLSEGQSGEGGEQGCSVQ
jgi:hypothetical protein